MNVHTQMAWFVTQVNKWHTQIMMYISHVLINALSALMIHINLNIFYTHVEHSPTKTIYIKYYI